MESEFRFVEGCLQKKVLLATLLRSLMFGYYVQVEHRSGGSSTEPYWPSAYPRLTKYQLVRATVYLMKIYSECRAIA